MKSMLIFSLFLSLCTAAHAEISRELITQYNLAIQSKDPVNIVDTAAMLGQSAIDNPDDTQSTLIAFETAKNICLRGACERAQPMLHFIQEAQPAAPNTEQIALLQAMSAWAANTDKKSEDALISSLLGLKDNQPSLISITAFDTLLEALLKRKDHKAVMRASKAAADHTYSVRDTIPAKWAAYQIISLSRDFDRSRKLEALPDTALLSAFLLDKLQDTDEKDSKLANAYYTADAWLLAMEAFGASRNSSKDRRLIEQSKKILADRAEKEQRESNELPLCKGVLAPLPRPSYPRNAALNGYVGSVIVGFDLVEGKSENFRVLASVPTDVFDEAALAAVKVLEWQIIDPLAPDGCRTSSHRPVVYPLQWTLGEIH